MNVCDTQAGREGVFTVSMGDNCLDKLPDVKGVGFYEGGFQGREVIKNIGRGEGDTRGGERIIGSHFRNSE